MFLVNILKVYLAPISKLEQIFLENHKLEFLFALHELFIQKFCYFHQLIAKRQFYCIQFSLLWLRI